MSRPPDGDTGKAVAKAVALIRVALAALGGGERSPTRARDTQANRSGEVAAAGPDPPPMWSLTHLTHRNADRASGPHDAKVPHEPSRPASLVEEMAHVVSTGPKADAQPEARLPDALESEPRRHMPIHDGRSRDRNEARADAVRLGDVRDAGERVSVDAAVDRPGRRTDGTSGSEWSDECQSPAGLGQGSSSWSAAAP